MTSELVGNRNSHSTQFQSCSAKIQTSPFASIQGKFIQTVHMLDCSTVAITPGKTWTIWSIWFPFWHME